MELSEWVRKQTALLDPPVDWRPDTRAALARQHARMEAAPRRVYWRSWPVWAGATTLACAALFLLPETRALAQQLWQFLTVGRVAVIRVNPWPAGVNSPQVKLIGGVIPPLPVSSVGEARLRAGFIPRLPRPGVLSSSAQLSTISGMSLGAVVKTADLKLALAKAGVTDQPVPAEWDGAQLGLHSSPTVIAEWPDIMLAQSLPLTITTPSGFDFAAFSGVILRILGVGPDQAKELAVRMGTMPVWLLPVDSQMTKGMTMTEISLRTGPATLLQDADPKDGLERVTVVWSVSDRVFILRGKLSTGLAITTANAVE